MKLSGEPAESRTEIERLTKERDEARAQVAAALAHPPQPSVSDAQSALEAYGRDKMWQGMMRAAALFPAGSRDERIISSAILADMEKLK